MLDDFLLRKINTSVSFQQIRLFMSKTVKQNRKFPQAQVL